MIQKKYSDLTYWKRYQDFLPEELRFKDGIFPNEEFWDWKGNYIHLDMMRNPKSNYKFILLHGGGANGRLLSTYGSALFHNGYEYIAPDFPGFGLTVAKKEYLTDYGVWVDLLTDLINREKENDDRPIILFGASVGGMLAYHGACKNKSVKGIIATCLADSRDIAARDALAKNKFWSRLGYFFMTYFPFITKHIDVRASWISKMNYITNSAEFSKIFINDSHVGKAKINLRFYKSMTEYDPLVEPENFNICPVLLVHPEQDKWTPVRISKIFFDKISGEKTIVILKGTGHYPYEEPGLQKMMEAIEEFIDRL